MQALAKIERGHAQDLEDVIQFLHGGFVSAAELREVFARIQPALVRYPANSHRFVLPPLVSSIQATCTG